MKVYEVHCGSQVRDSWLAMVPRTLSPSPNSPVLASNTDGGPTCVRRHSLQWGLGMWEQQLGIWVEWSRPKPIGPKHLSARASRPLTKSIPDIRPKDCGGGCITSALAYEVGLNSKARTPTELQMRQATINHGKNKLDSLVQAGPETVHTDYPTSDRAQQGESLASPRTKPGSPRHNTGGWRRKGRLWPIDKNLLLDRCKSTS